VKFIGRLTFSGQSFTDVQDLKLRVRTTVGSGSSPTRAEVTVTRFSVTPEPATALLVALGVFGLGVHRHLAR
jgi:hypothetical protein